MKDTSRSVSKQYYVVEDQVPRLHKAAETTREVADIIGAFAFLLEDWESRSGQSCAVSMQGAMARICDQLIEVGWAIEAAVKEDTGDKRE